MLLYHWLFSFAFAFLYVFISAYWPKIRLWYGAAYGLIITSRYARLPHSRWASGIPPI